MLAARVRREQTDATAVHQSIAMEDDARLPDDSFLTNPDIPRPPGSPGAVVPDAPAPAPPPSNVKRSTSSVREKLSFPRRVSEKFGSSVSQKVKAASAAVKSPRKERPGSSSDSGYDEMSRERDRLKAMLAAAEAEAKKAKSEAAGLRQDVDVLCGRLAEAERHAEDETIFELDSLLLEGPKQPSKPEPRSPTAGSPSATIEERRAAIDAVARARAIEQMSPRGREQAVRE